MNEVYIVTTNRNETHRKYFSNLQQAIAFVKDQPDTKIYDVCGLEEEGLLFINEYSGDRKEWNYMIETYYLTDSGELEDRTFHFIIKLEPNNE